MNARMLYEQLTGNACPLNQIDFAEWLVNYRKWLEASVEGVQDILYSTASAQEKVEELKKMFNK